MSVDTRRHPAVRVCVGELDEEIDVDIAPLIQNMWLAGIKTSMSCQGDDDDAVWIEFETVNDLEKFLTAVCPREDDDPALHNSIARSTGDVDSWWEYDLFPMDLYSRDFVEGVDDAKELEGALPLIVLNPSARFPRSDLAQVKQRMAAANREAV